MGAGDACVAAVCGRGRGVLLGVWCPRCSVAVGGVGGWVGACGCRASGCCPCVPQDWGGGGECLPMCALRCLGVGVGVGHAGVGHAGVGHAGCGTCWVWDMLVWDMLVWDMLGVGHAGCGTCGCGTCWVWVWVWDMLPEVQYQRPPIPWEEVGPCGSSGFVRRVGWASPGKGFCMPGERACQEDRTRPRTKTGGPWFWLGIMRAGEGAGPCGTAAVGGSCGTAVVWGGHVGQRLWGGHVDLWTRAVGTGGHPAGWGQAGLLAWLTHAAGSGGVWWGTSLYAGVAACMFSMGQPHDKGEGCALHRFFYGVKVFFVCVCVWGGGGGGGGRWARLVAK